MSEPLDDAGRKALTEAGWAEVEGRDAVTKTFVFRNFEYSSGSRPNWKSFCT